MTPKETTDEQTAITEVPWLLVGLIVLHVLFGLVALAWQAGSSWPIAMLWAGACSLSGATVGFLFGIPRTLQGDQEMQRPTILAHKRDAEPASGTNATANPEVASATADTETYRLRVNTNLEQISDWLTKILVGVGLTQFNEIPPKLVAAADLIAKGLGDNQAQKTLALALLIYFPVLGFLSGYLCTRLFLQAAFRRWDRSFELSKN